MSGQAFLPAKEKLQAGTISSELLEGEIAFVRRSVMAEELKMLGLTFYAIVIIGEGIVAGQYRDNRPIG